jgi:two-component system, cell cycle response regulator
MQSSELSPLSLSHSILVVDDEQQACNELAEALTVMGHRVHTANGGEEALEKINRIPFTIVIIDIERPRMDGMGLIRHLVAKNRDIAIIAVTGQTMKYKYTELIAAGAYDFISRPFCLNELEAKLYRLVRERHLLEELECLAQRDPLTGLYNRRFFQNVIRKEAARSIRFKHSLFLFFFDIDRFKDFNDIMGHQAGDDLLVHFAKILKSCIRADVDTACRYGGDEFLLLLPHLLDHNAADVADRILKKYRELDLEPTSLSVGIAKFKEKTGNIEEDVHDLIRRSDNALYRAKQLEGRDNVCIDDESLS